MNEFIVFINRDDSNEQCDAELMSLEITREVRVAVEHDFATEREVDVDNQELSAESAVGVENSQYEPEHTSVEHPMVTRSEYHKMKLLTDIGTVSG